MLRTKWRRYLPKRPRFLTSKLDVLFSMANTKVARYVGMSFEDLDRAILTQKKVMDDMDAVDWLVLLLMQAPRAAHAQSIMKEYPHGYHDRKARLLELIDFNDTFVSMILLLPDETLPDITIRLKRAMDDFCHAVHSKVFDDEQFEAVMHGLSREIAVFKAAENAGLNALMSSRMADAFGIDMQIADRVTGHYINIDCKTSSAFHFRIKDLIKHGRMDPEDLADAETLGWWEITNRGDHGKARIILLRVSQDEFGTINDFRFENEQIIVERLKQIIHQRGLHDGHFGGRFIETLE